MTIIVTATNTITTLDGVQVRVWSGLLPDGTPCQMFVRRIACNVPAGQALLERELITLGEPKEAPAAEVLAAFHRQLQREN